MMTYPIRVAQIVGKMDSGGVKSVVMNYYRNIDRTKVQFDFIMDGYNETPCDDEIRRLGGRIYKITPYSHNMIGNMMDCYHIFKKNNYHIVHSHLNTLSVFPLMAAKLAGISIRIAHNHSTAAKGEPKTILKYILRPFAKLLATHYFACSRYAGEWLFGKKCMEQGRVTVMPNAIDVERYSYKPEVRQRVRKELGIADKFVVGHVGRFVYPKNHTFLIDIFDEIHKQNPDSVLILIGSGELESAIRYKVDRLKLANAVMFMGLRQDVPELMQAMDVFVFPSLYEGFGMVAIEAQAAGLPTIVSKNIPNDAKISQLLSYCWLQQSAKEWSQRILSYTNGYIRIKVDEKVKSAGFEIRNAAKIALTFYLEVLE
jgi:glycosyltransferase involved in cell wall biosynthesis